MEKREKGDLRIRVSSLLPSRICTKGFKLSQGQIRPLYHQEHTTGIKRIRIRTKLGIHRQREGIKAEKPEGKCGHRSFWQSVTRPERYQEVGHKILQSPSEMRIT